MREQFEVMPFTIKTIRLERIFADKIFAAEFYHERGMYFDVAKVVIGDNCQLASNVAIYTAGHPVHPDTRSIRPFRSL